MSGQEKRKFIRVCLILFALTALPVIVGKFFIPFDWYSFRSWETLLDKRPCVEDGDLRTPFYPNRFLKRTEEGDLAGRSHYAVKKETEWYTDSAGFRNRDDFAGKKYEVVVLGDSDIVGSSLSQQEIFTEALQKMLQVNCYAMAPDGIYGFLKSERFRLNPPRILIVAENERNMDNWPAVYQAVAFAPEIDQALKSSPQPQRSAFCAVYRKLPFEWQAAYADIAKKPFLIPHVVRVVWAKWFGSGAAHGVLNKKEKMLFRNPSMESYPDLEGQSQRLDLIAEVIDAFRQELLKRGTILVYMPVPSKESVYWDWLPEKYKTGNHPPKAIEELTARLVKRNVPTIDLLSFFRARRAEVPGELLYHLDDSHWNAQAVWGAAFLVWSTLQQLGNLEIGNPANQPAVPAV